MASASIEKVPQPAHGLKPSYKTNVTVLSRFGTLFVLLSSVTKDLRPGIPPDGNEDVQPLVVTGPYADGGEARKECVFPDHSAIMTAQQIRPRRPTIARKITRGSVLIGGEAVRKQNDEYVQVSVANASSRYDRRVGTRRGY